MLMQDLLLLRRPTNKTALNRYVDELVRAIKKAIKEAVLLTRLLDKTKEG